MARFAPPQSSDFKVSRTHAEEMIELGRQAESRSSMDEALRFYQLAHKHQLSWLESVARGDGREVMADEASQPLGSSLSEIAKIRRRLERELEGKGGPRQSVKPSESTFLDEYSFFLAQRSCPPPASPPPPPPPPKARAPATRGAATRRPPRDHVRERRPRVPGAETAAAFVDARLDFGAPPPPPRRVVSPDGAAGRVELLDAILGSSPERRRAARPRRRCRARPALRRREEHDVGPGSLRAQLEQKEVQIAMLTKQLEAAGQSAITEVVPLAEAKNRLQAALAVIVGGDGASKRRASERQLTQAEAEAEMEKWDTFITHHPEHVEAQRAAKERWWDANGEACADAARALKTCVPPDVFASGTSRERLVAAGLSEALAQRVYERPALWLLRAEDAFAARVHDADLRGKFAFEDLDLRELRALYGRVRDLAFENDAAQDAWRDGLLERLQSRVAADDAGSLDERKRRHAAYPADDGEALGPFDADAPVVAVVDYDVAEEEDDDARSLAEMMEAATMGAEDDDGRFRGSDGDAAEGAAPPPLDAPRGKRGSIVSLAKAQLRRTSSFADGPAARSFVLPKKETTERVRAMLAARPARGGGDLMADLKKTLRRRSLTPPFIDDDDDDDPPELAAKPPPRSSPRPRPARPRRDPPAGVGARGPRQWLTAAGRDAPPEIANVDFATREQFKVHF
ncbi:hypothetical protein JL722_1355 [Aureococcus anophagefferens]|nr:hypothetical protein JL722_1355 [Aureococcus anophagefferens]